MEEHELIEGCKKGSHKAQRVLFALYAKRMLLLCRRYVRDHHDAEEALLNGFQKFFQSVDRFKYANGASLVAWLKRIMINECLHFLRRNSALSFVNEMAAEMIETEDSVIERMSAEEILHLVNKMPDGYRLVFNLYVVEGYNHREIAELLQITEGTSKSQFSKARTFLRGLLVKNEIVYER